MDELLDKPRTFRPLIMLALRGPMNMRQFVEACQQHRSHAQLTRDYLEELGYISVEVRRGTDYPSLVEIKLTPWGESIVEPLVVAYERVKQKRARDAKGGKS